MRSRVTRDACETHLSTSRARRATPSSSRVCERRACRCAGCGRWCLSLLPPRFSGCNRARGTPLPCPAPSPSPPGPHSRAVDWSRLGGLYFIGRGLPQDDTRRPWRGSVRPLTRGTLAPPVQPRGHARWGVVGCVPQDAVQAVEWWRTAADQGHAGAQYGLGSMYRSGRGVPQNDVQAAAWWPRGTRRRRPTCASCPVRVVVGGVRPRGAAGRRPRLQASLL